jgi:hypothetical protein
VEIASHSNAIRKFGLELFSAEHIKTKDACRC